jgi:trk system potassium uptake protein TrkH
MDLRPVLYIVGIFLCTLAGFMIIPLILDAYLFNETWKGFAISMATCLFCGGLLILGNKQQSIQITGQQAFVLTGLSWLSLSFFSAIPFLYTMPELSLVDALFESVSGLTTTGATILTNLESLPEGVLIWRALLQWLGGVGIIVMAISVLPFLKVGGMQLFRLESSEKEKVVPRATQLATYIIYVYLALTMICATAYSWVGMPFFDAIAHAMTTIATGGFSTRDTSFAEYETIGPELIAIIFMVLGCLPFVLYIKTLTGDWKAIINDQQAMGFLKTALLLCFIMIIYLTVTLDNFTVNTVIEAAFTTISLLTGTGYTDTNYMLWGGFAVGFLMFISCIGGCAGSTTCGIKIFRFQILYEVTKNQLYQLIHPNGVFTAEYNHQPLSVQIAASVMAFFFIFAVSFVVVSVLLLACGLDVITSLSGAIATLANVGPGLGNVIGPTGTYAPLPDNAKWIMMASMILGRLEFFTLLVFFVPRFWRA